MALRIPPPPFFFLHFGQLVTELSYCHKGNEKSQPFPPWGWEGTGRYLCKSRAFPAGGVGCAWEGGRWGACARGLRFSGIVCVLLHFAFFDAFRKDESGRSGAAWLASCALIFHRPSPRLPVTEASVTANSLSHLDLIVDSAGAGPEATEESRSLVRLPATPRAAASILKTAQKRGPRDSPAIASASSACPGKCIRCRSPLAARSQRTAGGGEL